MPTQGKPRHAKLPIASLSRNALNGAMPSQGTTCQGKARHARQSKGNASQGNACQGHAQRKASQGMPNARQAKACPTQGKPKPTQAKAMHAKAMPNARQGKPKATQAKATHAKAKPRPCRAKLPIASLSRNSLIGAMPLPRPRHAKARHANATQSKAMPTQGMPRRRHDMARQGKAKARPRQGKPKPRQAKANARQGKPNAWQGKHVKIQSVGWVASPSFGGKLNGKGGGGTNRSDAGLNLGGSWQQGHCATYNTPVKLNEVFFPRRFSPSPSRSVGGATLTLRGSRRSASLRLTDGPNGEPTRPMPGARRCLGTPRRRVLPTTIASTASPRAYQQPGLWPPPQSASVNAPSRSADRLVTVPHPTGAHRRPPHPLPSRQFQALFDSLFKVLFIFPSRYLFAIGLSPVFSLGQNLPPDWGCIPKQPDSPTAPRGATGVRAKRGLSPSPAPPSGGLGPGPPPRTLLRTTIRTPWAPDSQAGLFPVRSPRAGAQQFFRALDARRTAHDGHRGFPTPRFGGGVRRRGLGIYANRAARRTGGHHPPPRNPEGVDGGATTCDARGGACPRPNGFGRNLRSKTRWFTGFCNSHQVSHFATFFIDARAEISVAESRFDIFEDDDAARAHRFRGDGDALSRSSSLAQFAPVFVCTPGRGRPRERSATPPR
ncbi:unnamed protein product [Prunus brigantina]